MLPGATRRQPANPPRGSGWRFLMAARWIGPKRRRRSTTRRAAVSQPEATLEGVTEPLYQRAVLATEAAARKQRGARVQLQQALENVPAAPATCTRRFWCCSS